MPGSKSSVWNFFECKGQKVGKGEIVKCMLCSHEVVQQQGNASNMRKHLVTKHAKAYFEYEKGETKSAFSVSKKTKAKLNNFTFEDGDHSSSTNNKNNTSTTTTGSKNAIPPCAVSPPLSSSTPTSSSSASVVCK